MHSADSSFKTLIHHGLLLAAKVIARDNLNLGPAAISLAAAARLRRVLILLALEIEHDLQPDNSERPRQMGPRKPRTKSQSIPIFSRDGPQSPLLNEGDFKRPKRDFKTVNPARLLDRWHTLKTLLEAPDKRANRLALYMARRKAGLILPPDAGGHALPNRLGTEIAAIYRAMHQTILNASRARPPPIGPRPRPPPRIRAL